MIAKTKHQSSQAEGVLTKIDTIVSQPAKVLGAIGVLVTTFIAVFTFINSVNTSLEADRVFKREMSERLEGIENSIILSHETQKYILDKGGTAYWLSDSSGKTVEVGVGAEELTGRKAAQLMDYGWTLFIVEQDKPGLWEKIALTKAKDLNWDHKFRMFTPVGDTIKVHSTAIKVKKHNKTIYYMGELKEIEVEKNKGKGNRNK
jgi:PAS domain S-box-containing protein